MAIKRYGLRSRVIIYTLLPVVVIGLFFAGNYMLNRYNQIENSIIEEGLSIIEPMSLALENPYNEDDQLIIKKIINYVHRKHSDLIDCIAVLDDANNIYAVSNYSQDVDKFKDSKNEMLSPYTSVQFHQNYIVMKTPIFSEITRDSQGYIKGIQINSRLPSELIVRGFVCVKLNKTPALLALYKDLTLSLFVVLAGLVLALIFATNLIKEVVEPIKRMIKAINSIKDGQLDTRITGGMYGELERLRSGINGMARSISAYHNEMQQSIDQATSDLRQTADQLEIQNVELELAKRQAQEAARVKTEFLANMSHELRTPLNGVIGFTRQLLKSKLTSSQHEYLITIERSAKNLLSIINNILDFSKLEAGKLTFERIPFSIRDTVEETLMLMAPSAHEKSVDLSFYIDRKIPYLLVGDPLRLQQIILNLVSNAIKFSESGSVNLNIRCVEQKTGQHDEDERIMHVEFSVRDTGIGISTSQQQKLFQPFIQANNSISRTFGGTGLGLVITQKLVNLMGGGITVKSQVGKGSVFVTTLPLELAQMPGEQNPVISQMQNLNVLLIDANQWARDSMKQLMEDWNMKVYALSSVESVRTLPVQDFFISLIAVDEHTDRNELASCFDELPHDAPFIVLSNSHDVEINNRYKRMGAFDCLIKPVLQERLLECFNRRLNNAESSDAQEDDDSSEHKKNQKRNISVLAVDDNQANLRLITTLLAEKVAMVDGAISGSIAVEMCRTKNYDLIFMDIQMPVMDGISTLNHIRNDEHGSNTRTPVVAVTALAIPGERERLMKLGMNEYLSKPIDEVSLTRLLDKVGDMSSSEITVEENVHDEFLKGNTNSIRDPELALRQAAGKKDLALEMLEMFLSSIEPVQDAIGRIDTIQESEMIKIIHKMAGGAAYCGMPKVQKICNLVEVGLRGGKKLRDVEPELYELDDMLESAKKDRNLWIDELKN